MFLNTSRHLSSINSGHIELILKRGMSVFSKIYSSNSAKREFQISLVCSSPQAERFTPVSTTSFHPAASNSKISSTISSLSLK
ncbi:MAG: hypothetical protein ACPHY8_02600 [Patescibacteria group bacterium]